MLFACVIMASLQLHSAGAARVYPNNAVQWNSAVLQGVRDAKLSVPMAARALAIVHTCMYDAWAAYDERAVGTQLGGALRDASIPKGRSPNKERAVSYAAYGALVDILPADTESVYKPLMRGVGYDPNDHSTDIETPPRFSDGERERLERRKECRAQGSCTY